MMLALSLSLLLVALGCGAATALNLHESSRDLVRLQARLRHATQWRREHERMQQQIEQWLELQRTAELTIATGNEVVRTLHQGISAIPFGILEAIPVTRDTTRIVRSVHDQISNTVYDVIGGTNKLLGSVLRQSLKTSANLPPRAGAESPADRALDNAPTTPIDQPAESDPKPPAKPRR